MKKQGINPVNWSKNIIIVDADGDKWLFVDPDERRQAFRERGYAAMMESVRDTLELFGTQFDTSVKERHMLVVMEQFFMHQGPARLALVAGGENGRTRVVVRDMSHILAVTNGVRKY